MEEKVRLDENELLSRGFSEEEIREDVFSSYADSAPGPDGLSFMFYRTFWETVRLFHSLFWRKIQLVLSTSPLRFSLRLLPID
jgi:hypothetical protein